MIKLILIAALTFSVSALAGPGHGHSHGGHSHGRTSHGHSHKKVVSKIKTQSIGKAHVERLIKSGKIDASWKNAKYETSTKKKFGKRTEWVVTFENEKGKKLYIFLKLSGEFVAANFTGK